MKKYSYCENEGNLLSIFLLHARYVITYEAVQIHAVSQCLFLCAVKRYSKVFIFTAALGYNRETENVFCTNEQPQKWQLVITFNTPIYTSCTVEKNV